MPVVVAERRILKGLYQEVVAWKNMRLVPVVVAKRRILGGWCQVMVAWKNKRLVPVVVAEKKNTRRLGPGSGSMEEQKIGASCSGGEENTY